MLAADLISHLRSLRSLGACKTKDPGEQTNGRGLGLPETKKHDDPKRTVQTSKGQTG